jgi:hypothetical protein
MPLRQSDGTGKFMEPRISDSLQTQRLSAFWLLPPALLGWIGIHYHEWWRDEANTWLVIRPSTTVKELFEYTGFNGHPKFYYLFAWAVRHLWPSPASISFTNLAFALGAIFLFFRSAPATRLQAVLFSLGFFPLYQYGIIARSYAMLMFLLFLYCYIRSKRPDALVPRLLILATLAQVHLIAIAAVGGLLVFEWAILDPAQRKRMASWIASGVIVASMAISLWQLAPHNKEPIPLWGAPKLSTVISGFSEGFAPNFGVLNNGAPIPHLAQRGLGFALFLAGIFVLIPNRTSLLAYSLLAGSLLSVCIFVYSGFRWHHGLYFIFFIASLWISSSSPLKGARAHVMTSIFILQFTMSLYAIGCDVLRPYSDGRLAAQYLLEQHLDNLPLVGINLVEDKSEIRYQWEIDAIQPVMFELGGHQIYDPIADSFESFYRHYTLKTYSPVMDMKEANAKIQLMAPRLGGRFVVVGFRQTSSDVPMQLPSVLRKLTDLPRSTDFGEDYSIYMYP